VLYPCTVATRSVPKPTTSHKEWGVIMTGTVKLQASRIGGVALAALAASVLAAPAAFAGTTPAAPSGLRATSTNFTDVSLAWNPAGTSGINGYRILVDGAWRTYSYQSDRGSVTGLLPGKTYTITLQAQDSAGNVSPQSAPLTVTTPADQQAPSAPSGLSDAWSGDGIFVLEWSQSSDNADTTWDVQYQVYAGSALVASVTSANSTVVCLDPGEYTFSVRARDRSGNLSAPSGSIVATG
jgi:chitinase